MVTDKMKKKGAKGREAGVLFFAWCSGRQAK